tara:strand:- start:329 stop:610 length:282 start_codon:yes stop_codon:yes gene_type:complete
MGTIYCLADQEWGTNYTFYYSTALRSVVAEVHGGPGQDSWAEDRDVYELELNAREYEMLMNGTITLDEIEDYDSRWEAITFEGNELSLCDFNP